ncbi:uncharacterized protein [Ranitomeya imitator]|uniref:uncharacterized protein isoform X2 n=1 Tax=Ranitomeya imitator TaxID=111125 RepID=UPI0037E75C0A
MFRGPYDFNPFLPSKEPGNSECPNQRDRESTDQYPASGRIPGTQDKESGAITVTQIGIGEEKKIQILEGHRGLPAEPCLPVARYSALHQAPQLTKLFWFHRQQARHLKFFFLPFFFREQPQPSKGKTRRGGQCRRGTQKSDGNTLTESLVTPHVLSTGLSSHALLPLRVTRPSTSALLLQLQFLQGALLSRTVPIVGTPVGPHSLFVASRHFSSHLNPLIPHFG